MAKGFWLSLMLLLFASEASAQSVFGHTTWYSVCFPRPCRLAAQVKTSTGDLVDISYSIPTEIFSIISRDRTIKHARLRLPGGPPVPFENCRGSQCALDTATSADLLRRCRAGALTASSLVLDLTYTDGSTLGPVEFSLDDFEAHYGVALQSERDLN